MTFRHFNYELTAWDGIKLLMLASRLLKYSPSAKYIIYWQYRKLRPLREIGKRPLREIGQVQVKYTPPGGQGDRKLSHGLSAGLNCAVIQGNLRNTKRPQHYISKFSRCRGAINSNEIENTYSEPINRFLQVIVAQINWQISVQSIERSSTFAHFSNRGKFLATNRNVCRLKS
jgi:hypothetical protein